MVGQALDHLVEVVAAEGHPEVTRRAPARGGATSSGRSCSVICIPKNQTSTNPGRVRAAWHPKRVDVELPGLAQIAHGDGEVKDRLHGTTLGVPLGQTSPDPDEQVLGRTVTTCEWQPASGGLDAAASPPLWS